MWSDTEIAASDIEPYRATPNDVVAETDVTEPYRAVRSSESNDMSIDISESGNALDMESTMSLEEQFASDIESMSFDDLSAEQARLDELSRMDDLDIFSTYDIQQKEKYDSELLDTLTDGLSKEALEHLRDGLANGDPEVYDYFGLNGDVEDGNNEGPTLTLRR